MKPIYAHLAGAIGLSFTIAACVPAPDSTPAPQTAATPTPSPTPSATPLPPPPKEANWIDRPQTSGSWSYRQQAGGSTALFGGRVNDALFSITCDRSASRIVLTRAAQARGQATMTIRTETADRTLSAAPVRGEMPGIAASLQAGDPLLDAIALTRGRFAVEMASTSALYLPNWAEVTRAIEDCR